MWLLLTNSQRLHFKMHTSIQSSNQVGWVKNQMRRMRPFLVGFHQDGHHCEADDLTNCMGKFSGQVSAKVCRIRVHCPLSLKLLFFRELTPCKLTSARTHSKPSHARTHSHARAAPHAHALLFLFALLQKAEFALNSTAHCAVLGKRSWI